VREGLVGFEGRVTVAAVNGPAAVVVSGDEDAVVELEGSWREDGVRVRRLRVSHAFHSQRMDGMLEEFAEMAASVVFSEPRIPIVSNVTGEVVSPEVLCSAEYWARHVREPVRFMDGVRSLKTQGVMSFLEIGPDGILSAMTQDSLQNETPVDSGMDAAGDIQDAEGVLAVPVLRSGHNEAESLFGALAEVWVRGVSVDWGAVFEGSGARRVALPTYAFQRERFWLKSSVGVGDVAGIGQGSASHPLLGAQIGLADEQGWLFTGRLSLESHPWVADHVVLGVVLLPGTAYLELALHVGALTGCGTVRELVLEAPLVLGERDAVQLQVSVGELDEAEERTVAIYSRPEHVSVEDGSEGEWTRHASGILAPEDHTAVEDRPSVLADGAWPPADAESVDVDSFYDYMTGIGFDYGPAFLGVRAAWRRGAEVFAEVALPEDRREEASSFGIHPALLDAPLQAASLWTLDRTGGQEQGLRVPFSFGDATLRRSGTSKLRVRLSIANDDTPDGDNSAGASGMSLLIADDSGELVASLELAVRAISAKDLAGLGQGQESLYRLGWRPVSLATEPAVEGWALLGDEQSALAGSLRTAVPGLGFHHNLGSLSESMGDVPPRVVLVDLRDHAAGAGGVDMPGLAHGLACEALALVQEWLSDGRFGASRLVFLTEGAIGAQRGEAVDVSEPRVAGEDVGAGGRSGALAQACVWGLVRSAQSENPERFVLVDVDDKSVSLGLLAGALGLGEPQLVVRGGEVLLPRLERAGVVSGEDSGSGVGVGVGEGLVDGATGVGLGGGTVLVTGGTGGLGGLVARHLVVEHGARRLLLVSRSGRDASGAVELEEELSGLGASVSLVACDVSDRDALKGVLEGISEEFPLCGVVHAAGVLDDGVVESLTPERVGGVLAAKADAAWYLHELTKDLDLSLFVLFSSAAGTFGAPGQGSYAAANAFLDRLAAYRHEQGLVASAMAWGPWEQTSGMTGGLSEADRSRMARSGMGTLSVRQGLALFDRVWGEGEALMLPVALDLPVLRSHARADVLPSMLSGLVPAQGRRSSEQAGSLARRLHGVPESDRESIVLDLVRSQVASVLGHATPQAIDPQRAFLELGFDSLAAVELRNRLNAQTALRLPATLVFDYPTTIAVTGYLLGELAQDRAVTAPPGDAELDGLERVLVSISSDDSERARITARLQTLLAGLSDVEQEEGSATVAEQIGSATDDEVFDFIDQELNQL
jgi:acyl transferase domain-containing protein/acyl carrier protein